MNNRLKQIVYDRALDLFDSHVSSIRHFCFIVRRNKIICEGQNQSFKTHRLSAIYGHRFHSVHAELDILARFPYPAKFLKDYRWVNVRLNASKQLGLSRPCISCQKFLASLGVTDLWYSNNSGDFERF